MARKRTSDPTTDPEEQSTAEQKHGLRDTLRRFAKEEDDDDESGIGSISLRSVLGGDILQSPFFLRQVVFIMFVIFLMLLYTANRYAAQEDLIVIDSLQIRLQETQYRVLTQSSELMNLTRQTKVEEQLRKMGDTTLLSTHAQTPPYEIRPISEAKTADIATNQNDNEQ